ncbi:MAG: hypothetical protein ACKO01_10110, partial [Erythrobacter sp.]
MKQAALQVGLAGLVMSGLGGCVVNISDSKPDQAEAVPPPPAPMICNAEKAQYHVGHSATEGT